MVEDSPAQKSSVKPRRGGRKSGGRAGRHAERKKGTVGMAVHPGIEGGAYKPLSDRDIERIHDTALHVLANIGIGDPIPEILEYALPKGCTLDDHGRLLFPRSLVEELIDISAKEYVAYAPNPKNDQEVKGKRVHMATSGEAVNILDFETQTYRPSTLVDLYDAARLADQLEHIHNFGQPFIATEWSEDVFVHDMNIAYAELAGTDKPIALGIAMVDHVDPLIALFDAYLGKEGGFLERPFCIFGGWISLNLSRFLSCTFGLTSFWGS